MKKVLIGFSVFTIILIIASIVIGYYYKRSFTGINVSILWLFIPPLIGFDLVYFLIYIFRKRINFANEKIVIGFAVIMAVAAIGYLASGMYIRAMCAGTNIVQKIIGEKEYEDCGKTPHPMPMP